MTKMTIKNALTKIGVTDKEKQDAFLTAFEGKRLAELSEQDVIKELERAGITDEEKQNDFFAAVKKSEILDQELDIEELEAVSGGDCSLRKQEKDLNCCVKDHYRTYLKDGCAGTIQVTVKTNKANHTRYITNSACLNNDRCSYWAVDYTDLEYDNSYTV